MLPLNASFYGFTINGVTQSAVSTSNPFMPYTHLCLPTLDSEDYVHSEPHQNALPVLQNGNEIT